MRYSTGIVIMIVCCLFTACKKELQLISAEKQIILPGSPTAARSVRYQIQINVQQEAPDIQINAVRMPILGEESNQLGFDIMELSTNTVVPKISKKGKYVLTINPATALDAQLLAATDEAVVIVYTDQAIEQELKVTNFVKKTKRIR